MTDSTVAADIHQTLDVHSDFGAEVALYLVFSSNDLTDLTGLLVGPVLDLDVLIDTSLLQDLR